MKSITIFLLFTLIITGCLSKAENIIFFDSQGRAYQSQKIKESFHKYYPDVETPFVVLVKSRGESEELAKQREILNSVDSEALRLIYVYADTEKENRAGYYVEQEAAKRLLSEADNFRVLVISPTGKTLLDQNNIIIASQIKAVIENSVEYSTPN